MAAFDSRTEMEVLDRATCNDLLQQQQLGRIAFSVDGEISIIPVNYVIDGHRVVFRTAEGVKLAAATTAGEVAFEIDGIDPETRTGWSVIVHGTLRTVEDAGEIERLRALRLRPWARAPKEHWVTIESRRTSGRRILTVAEESKIGPYSKVTTPPGGPEHRDR